jgi:hypothetical protein
LRVRPFLPQEPPEGCVDICQSSPAPRIRLHDPRHKGVDREYDFDGIYSEEARTIDIFDERIAPSLSGLFRGLSATVFAHGATGSGKTFTMEGSTLEAPEDRETAGIVALAAQRLFALLAEEELNYRVTCSLFEIHRDKVRDLVDETGKKDDLAMREDMGGDVQIADLTEVEVKSIKELLNVYATGVGRRVMAKTGLNEVSSRSHCCFQVKVTRIEKTEEAPVAPARTPLSYHAKPKPKVEGKLILIDLAGFEDNRQTENAGDRLQESRTINTSHFTLGKCFLSLKRGDYRVPSCEVGWLPGFISR